MIGSSFDIQTKKLGSPVVLPTLKKLGRSQLVSSTIIFRSTQPIGTLKKISKEIENIFNLIIDKDIFLGYCPERAVEGNVIEEEINLPKIIGATEISAKKIHKYFEIIGGKIIDNLSSDEAEFLKLIDNSYRQLNFAFVK